MAPTGADARLLLVVFALEPIPHGMSSGGELAADVASRTASAPSTTSRTLLTPTARCLTAPVPRPRAAPEHPSALEPDA